MTKPKKTNTDKPLFDDQEPIENIEPEEYVSIYEASEQLNTSESAIKIWIEHGHLKGDGKKVLVRSIKECKFNQNG